MKSESVEESVSLMGGARPSVQFCVGDGGGDGEDTYAHTFKNLTRDTLECNLATHIHHIQWVCQR